MKKLLRNINRKFSKRVNRKMVHSDKLEEVDAIDPCGKCPGTTKLDAVHKAFALVLMLERILDYAVREAGSGKLCASNIQNIRLVCKSWKHAASTVLWRNFEPLYNLNLREHNSLNGSPFVRQNGKLLDQFVNYWTTEEKSLEQMPIFRLKMEREFFLQENYNSLLFCLQKLSCGLVELEMNVPDNLGSLTGIFPNVSLLVLQKLKINFTGNNLETSEEIELDIDHASNVTFLFQSLLNSNNSLKLLTISHSRWDYFQTFPGVQCIPLPDTLTKIEIDFTGTTNVFQLLTKNKLPNLRELSLGACCSTRFPVGLLHEIFENACKTLCKLQLTGSNYFAQVPRATNMLCFPVMEKLHTLEIDWAHFELEMACLPKLQSLFPKLRNLDLRDQTPAMLEKWTTGQTITSVEKFGLGLIDESQPILPNHVLPLLLQDIKSVHSKFPNVNMLSLTISRTEMSGLKYIFKEMGQLIYLGITVEASECFTTSIHWDSLLIGAPKELVTEMNAHPELGLRFTNRKQPSIRMLKNLYCLTLRANINDDNQDDIANTSLITDLAFVYGFFMMPKLITLDLNGRFMVSKQMANKWKRKKGRKIHTSSE